MLLGGVANRARRNKIGPPSQHSARHPRLLRVALGVEALGQLEVAVLEQVELDLARRSRFERLRPRSDQRMGIVLDGSAGLLDDLAGRRHRLLDHPGREVGSALGRGHTRLPVRSVDADRIPQRAEYDDVALGGYEDLEPRVNGAQPAVGHERPDLLVERQQAARQVSAPSEVTRQAT